MRVLLLLMVALPAYAQEWGRWDGVQIPPIPVWRFEPRVSEPKNAVPPSYPKPPIKKPDFVVPPIPSEFKPDGR